MRLSETVVFGSCRQRQGFVYRCRSHPYSASATIHLREPTLAAGTLLQRFLRTGVVLEGRGRRLAASVATILTVGSAMTPPSAAASPRNVNGRAAEQLVKSIYVQDLPDLPSMGILHNASYPKVKNFTRADDPGRPLGSPKAATAERSHRPVVADYAAMVRDIQAQVDREFPNRIHIVDRSNSVTAELDAIGTLTGKPLKENETFIIGGDPHTSPAFGPKATVCIVVGPPPQQNAHDVAVGFAEEQLGSPIDLKKGSGVTDETWHRFAVWHEVGHCLLGSNEAKADAFGAMKTIADTNQVNILDDLIVVRELMERISTPLDEHIISPTLRQLPKRYSGNPSVDAGRSLREIAQIVDKLQTPIDAWTILFRNRLAMTHFDGKQRDFNVAQVRFLVPVKEGFVATNFHGWLKASTALPEVARIEQLIGYLSADPAAREVPGPFAVDRAASGKAVTALAGAGDPVARWIAPLFGPQQPSTEVPLVNDGLVSSSQVEGRLIAFDRSSAVVKYAKDLQSFLVRDAVTNRPVLAGNAKDGVTKVFDPSHVLTRTADRNARSPSF
ncbi:hypothetical protein ACVIGB_000868 [Bradyrhizobium sp. USDA 4341]